MLIKRPPITNGYIAVNNETSIFLQKIGFLPLFTNNEGLYYYMGEERLLEILKERRDFVEI